MLIIMGLRNVSLGQYDVEFSYVPRFYEITELTLKEIILSGFSDKFFHIMTKIFTFISTNVNLWIFCVSIPIVFSVTYLIYSESKIPSLSFILFLGLNYYGYNFTVLRHSLALSFIIFSYLFYKNKKKTLSIIAFIIACSFHISAIIFILAFIFSKKKISLKNIVIIGILLFISMNKSETLLNYVFKYLTIDRFIRYEQHIESFNMTTFSINACVYISSFINCKTSIRKNGNMVMLFNIGILSLVMLSFTTTFALFFRLAMFFGIFNIILLPNSIYYQKNKYIKLIMYLGIVIVFTFYFLFFAINNAWINPYSFFWN